MFFWDLVRTPVDKMDGLIWVLSLQAGVTVAREDERREVQHLRRKECFTIQWA